MSSPFSSKAIIGCYVFLTLFKAIIRCRVLLHLKPLLDVESFFHPKPLLGVMSFSLYSKPLLDIVIFLHLKPLLDVESFSSKAIIGCHAFLTLFKAIIGYCD